MVRMRSGDPHPALRVLCSLARITCPNHVYNLLARSPEESSFLQLKTKGVSHRNISRNHLLQNQISQYNLVLTLTLTLDITTMSDPSQSQHTARESQPTQGSTQSVSSEQNRNQLILNHGAIKSFLERINKSHSVGEMIRAVPAPAFDRSRVVLEKTFQAFGKVGSINLQLAEWKDCLRTETFKNIQELNCIKFPSIQTSQLALETEKQGRLQNWSFSAAQTLAKKEMLKEMIKAKELEVEVLETLCDHGTVTTALNKVWMDLHLKDNKETILPEHHAILTESTCAERIVSGVISLGLNSLARIQINKEQKKEKKAEADVDMTDAGSSGGKKKIEALIKESLKRHEQSKKDKKLSGKGKGRAGPPKKQNQKTGAKNTKKTGRVVKPNKKGGKRDKSTKKQQKKR